MSGGKENDGFQDSHSRFGRNRGAPRLRRHKTELLPGSALDRDPRFHGTGVLSYQ
jgi:hypothetical protein